MNFKQNLICLICILFCSSLQSQKLHVTSSDGNIVFNFKLIDKSAFYNVTFKGKTIVDYSSLSLEFDNGKFEKNLKLNKPFYRDTTEDYNLVVGKTSHVLTHYKELIIPLEEILAPNRKINLIVRVFDDGVALRYEFLQQQGWTKYSLLDENTSFKLAGDPIVHALFLPDYTSSHEGFYTTTPFSKVVPDSLMDMPALFELPDNVYVGITEAELVDYAGMYLAKHNGVLVSRLSPLPNQTAIKVKEVLPHRSPWRVMLIGDRIGLLIESNIITTLNEPCKIKDVSWLKPGKTTFPWWNGNVVPDTINAPGNNFVTAKYYIDFCARNGLEYHSVVEYGLHQWYMDDGINFQPGPHADVTTPVPGLDMKQICDYAKQLGVGIRVWVHWAALYPKLDTAFALFEQWGLKGMMVDFMDRDDQEMVNIQTEILQKAAQHHLHIQFHGAYKPTGLSRTYPNEFTREGTLNYEADKWTDGGLSPNHDINIPFTRMLAGSTDYHLGGFRAVPGKDFTTPHYTRPLVLGTRCHMLGMYVVLENYLQMVCDYPEAYEDEPGFEFIKQIPTTWDETKVPDAKVNEFITVARRKNQDWYMGAITNNNARYLNVPLNFLGNGTYIATIYTDAPDATTNPNHLIKQEKFVTSKDFISVHLASGGGFVAYLKKQ
jgi:alpha-glucosidase